MRRLQTSKCHGLLVFGMLNPNLRLQSYSTINLANATEPTKTCHRRETGVPMNSSKSEMTEKAVEAGTIAFIHT